ncbi:MAG TPA: hypothetical protein IAA98_14470 [Candidatus Avipropionibacterium avicola]|uniref:Uncharacterized protein n=2 Tax=Bacteria TaxID=2 RepID=A0A9D1GZP8_9ACTN|nr:hypothetical protein [Candidatus Avipropionibacterium avicola]
MFGSQMARRTLLGGGLAVGAAAALAGCRTDGGGGTGTGGDSGGGDVSSIRPNYIPYDGPQPDLPGDGAIGVPNGFLSYPSPPPSTGGVPVGLSKPVEMMVQGVASATPHSKNQWWQMWDKDLGAELSVNVVDSTQYTAKFQTATAGGTFAEITQIVTVPQLPKLLESMFTDLTPYLSGDNIAKYPNLAAHPADAWDMCIINGKIWGITNPRIVAGTVGMTRGDILEEKGIDLIPELNSGEDFLDLCREITDRKAGTFAIGQIPQNWTIPLIMESLGGANVWQVDNGTWISQYETPEYERALEIVTQMYDEGLFHPNSYSDLSSTAVWFDGGATAIFAQNFASWQTRAGTDAKPYDYPCGVVKMPKWDGGGVAEKHLGAPGYGAPVGLAKTDDEARIDELLKVADYFASPFGTEEFLKVNYGVEGRQYNLKDGQVRPVADVTDERIPGPAYYGATNAVNIYSPGSQEATELLHAYCQEMIPTGVRNPSYGKFSDTAASKGAAADKKLNDIQGDIIQGRAKLSEWADAVKEWKSAAGDAVAREYAEQE